MMHEKIHRNEKEIIRVLYKEGSPLSILEVAQQAGMSWVTAKKYLRGLHEKAVIEDIGLFRNPRYRLRSGLLREVYRIQVQREQLRGGGVA